MPQTRELVGTGASSNIGIATAVQQVTLALTFMIALTRIIMH